MIIATLRCPRANLKIPFISILRLEDAAHRQSGLRLRHHRVGDRARRVREGHEMNAVLSRCEALEHMFRYAILRREVDLDTRRSKTHRRIRCGAALACPESAVEHLLELVGVVGGDFAAREAQHLVIVSPGIDIYKIASTKLCCGFR